MRLIHGLIAAHWFRLAELAVGRSYRLGLEIDREHERADEYLARARVALAAAHRRR